MSFVKEHIPLQSQGNKSSSLLPERYIPLIIMGVVFLFNLPYLFVDTLWHDDSYWYFKATEGDAIYDYDFRSNPWRDAFYSYGMFYLGLPAIRGIYVIVMGLGSWLSFILYRKIFGISFFVAITAAIIPNILPSLRGIPVGLNASYAMFSLVPILASLILWYFSVVKEGLKSFLLLLISFGLFVFGLQNSTTGSFLVPNAFFFFFFVVFLIPSKRIKGILYGLMFFGWGVYKFLIKYLEAFGSRTAAKINVDLPLSNIISRAQDFLDMSCLVGFNSSFSIYIIVALLIAGIMGMLISEKMIRIPEQFNRSIILYKLVVLGWFLCWMICNSIVYVGFTARFRPWDYAYVFNFGSIFLQIIGIYYLVSILSSRNWLRGKAYKSAPLILSAFLLLIVGGQKLIFRYSKDSWYPKFEKSSRLIRNSLKSTPLPENTQILLLGDDLNVWHKGLVETNSGFIRYLLARNDLFALIGKDEYPVNVFEPWNGDWFSKMNGFSPEYPVIAYCIDNGDFERIDLLLKVVSTCKKELPRLQWTLYDIRDETRPPSIMESGIGVSSYQDYLSKYLPAELKNSHIAFSPGYHTDKFVDSEEADAIVSKSSLIKGSLQVSEFLTVLNVSAYRINDEVSLEILIRVDSLPGGNFKLGYKINDNTHSLKLWNYVLEGDHLLISTPPVYLHKQENRISLGFVNLSYWPHRPLLFAGDGLKGDSRISLTVD